MSSIDTLILDIKSLLNGDLTGVSSTPEPVIENVLDKLCSSRELKSRDYLWASEYGDSCLRKVWYKCRTPEDGEALPPSAKMKFAYGDLLEEVLLNLAERAGHAVAMQQRRVVITMDGEEILSGKIDAVIDGKLVDVKTMSTFSFQKYSTQGLTEDNDTFGYRWQVALYYHQLVEEGLITDSGDAYLLAIDKQLGHIALIPCVDLPTKAEVGDRAGKMLAAIRSSKVPDRGHMPVPDGRSGNQKLGTACSYCAFKHKCWPGLRTFMYSRGPVYLTSVKKKPLVPEQPSVTIQE